MATTPCPVEEAAEVGRTDMGFQRYRPQRLSPLVAVIWEQRATLPSRWRILPSGWVELLFRLGPAIRMGGETAGRVSVGPASQFCFLSGLHTRPLDFAFEAFHMFGVQMHPVAVRAYFGLPCSEVVDAAVAGDLVLPDLPRIEDGLRSAPDFAARARWMEAELVDRLCGAGQIETALQMQALASTLTARGVTSARELDRRLGYSRSHAHRLFGEWLGQSATDAIRLARFVRAIHALHSDGGTLTEIGHRVGYFDQSHFIRDFRAFADMTPGEYRRQRWTTPGQLPS